MPSLMTRSASDDWRNQGAKDLAARVQEQLTDIVKTHAAPALKDKTLAALQTIRQKGEKEMLKD
jgi:trimethylamine:corrinoid methyltransferase-like protein